MNVWEIADDVAAFCDDLIKDSRTCAELHQQSLSGPSGPAGIPAAEARLDRGASPDGRTRP